MGQVKSLEVALKAPEEVVHLRLKRKKLKEFPIQILQLKNLEVLDLSNNKLTSLPDELIQLKHLKKLILSRNYFVEFPAVLMRMKQLEHIDLWNNFLEDLPEGAGDFPSIRFFDIRGVLLMPDVYEKLSGWYNPDIFKISPPCDCMYKNEKK